MDGMRTGLLHSTDELRKLILENPELPLLVFAGEDSVCRDYSWTACGSIHAHVGEFLDCQQDVNDERVYTDRQDFEGDIECYSDFDGTDDEFDAYIKSQMKKYEPFWKPCIILYVDN